MPKLDAGTGQFAPSGTRPVYFDAGFIDTPLYDRATLPPGAKITGPAVVEEFGSTTVVFPGQTVEVDPHGILVIRPVAQESAK
jgi:N-methylhydantoinase A